MTAEDSAHDETLLTIPMVCVGNWTRELSHVR